MSCWQIEQTQNVGDGTAAAPDALGYDLLRQRTFLHQAADAPRFFDGVEILALDVLHQRGLLPLDLVPLAHDGGNG